jgi:hypothetical protein
MGDVVKFNPDHRTDNMLPGEWLQAMAPCLRELKQRVESHETDPTEFSRDKVMAVIGELDIHIDALMRSVSRTTRS